MNDDEIEITNLADTPRGARRYLNVKTDFVREERAADIEIDTAGEIDTRTFAGP